MTDDGKHVIEEFATLPDPAKREVLTELLRMARYLDYGQMSEDDFTSPADALFLEYDRHESAE